MVDLADAFAMERHQPDHSFNGPGFVRRTGICRFAQQCAGAHGNSSLHPGPGPAAATRGASRWTRTMGMAHHAHRQGHGRSPTRRYGLEEAGMMESTLRRIFQIPEMIIVLSITALACLPLALSNLVRGVGVILLLLTLIGALLALALTAGNVRKLS